jgi:hypothetical protein
MSKRSFSELQFAADTFLAEVQREDYDLFSCHKPAQLDTTLAAIETHVKRVREDITVSLLKGAWTRVDTPLLLRMFFDDEETRKRSAVLCREFFAIYQQKFVKKLRIPYDVEYTTPGCCQLTQYAPETRVEFFFRKQGDAYNFHLLLHRRGLWKLKMDSIRETFWDFKGYLSYPSTKLIEEPVCLPREMYMHASYVQNFFSLFTVVSGLTELSVQFDGLYWPYTWSRVTFRDLRLVKLFHTGERREGIMRFVQEFIRFLEKNRVAEVSVPKWFCALRYRFGMISHNTKISMH